MRVAASRVVLACVAALGIALAAAGAHADVLRCERAILKEAARFAAARVTALSKCEDQIVRGRLPAPTECAGEPKTALLLARAEMRLRRGIARACGGADRTCGTGGDDESPAALGWPPVCPAYEATACAQAIDDCADVADCVACLDGATGDRALALAYEPLLPSDPRTERRLNKCQRAIGTATARLIALRTALLARCWDARYRARHAEACPDPGDGRTADRIARAAATLERRVCKACGGGPRCDQPGGLAPAAIGVPDVCPDVSGCGGVPVTLEGVADCNACVAARATDCATAAAVPALSPYPGACLDVPQPPVCGDGTLAGREACDDGNAAGGDGCSADCVLEDGSALCAGITPVAGTALATRLVAAGLDRPLHVTAPPLDPTRVFVVEQPGRIRVVEHGTLHPVPFLAIERKVGCCGERGLLGLAFHPDYAVNGRFFVNYVDTGGDTVIARYQVSADPNLADPASEVVLLTVAQPESNHNGGLVAFGPDGYLWIGMGDGGGAGDPLGAGQSDTTVLGKMLRLDVDVETPPFHAAPADNPAPGAPAPLDLVWAKGLRNPWRFAFDRLTGELSVADVGQGAREEVNVVPATAAGLNYGWNVFEGRTCYPGGPAFPSCPDPPAGFTVPVLEYDHDAGCSITGGFVYRGCRLPDLHGTYFYADFCSAFVRTFAGVAGGEAQNLADRTVELDPPGARTLDSPTSFGEDARGELYVTDLDGEVYAIVPDE